MSYSTDRDFGDEAAPMMWHHLGPLHELVHVGQLIRMPGPYPPGCGGLCMVEEVNPGHVIMKILPLTGRESLASIVGDPATS